MWVGNGVTKSCRYEFLLVSCDLFFILLYYSYKITRRNFRTLRPAVVELCQCGLEMGSPKATDTSSCSFSLISFYFYSSIATKSIYKFLKPSAHPLSSYINFGRY